MGACWGCKVLQCNRGTGWAGELAVRKAVTIETLESFRMPINRREFSMGAAGAALVSSALFAPMVHAQAAKPVAGRDFQLVEVPVAVEAPAGSVEVVEFFSYMCHFCNAFEPTFYAWTKKMPKGAALRRIPVPFLPHFEVLQRTYFAVEEMKLVDKLHGSIFAAIHEEHRNFNDAAAIADWVATQGVDRAMFLAQFNSFTVVAKTARATQLTNACKVAEVPTLGVAGRFLTQGTDKGLRVVEALVAQVKAGG